jgi:hypothetical protein
MVSTTYRLGRLRELMRSRNLTALIVSSFLLSSSPLVGPLSSELLSRMLTGFRIRCRFLPRTSVSPLSLHIPITMELSSQIAREDGSEYLACSDELRAYISGFTGSAGTAIVRLDEA